MSSRVKRTQEQELVWSVLQAVGKLITLPFRGMSASRSKHRVDGLLATERDQIEQRWREVRELMQQNGTSHFRMAILHADTIFDSALKALHMPGNTMGERLKASERQFDRATYQMVWQAHKIRNRLAHEIESEVMNWEAREAVASFEQGLREIGVLTDRHELGRKE